MPTAYPVTKRPVYSIRTDDGKEVWWTTGRAAALRWARDFSTGYAKGHGFREDRCHVYLVRQTPSGPRLVHKATYEPGGAA